MGKGPCLGPVTIDYDRLMRQCLFHETWDHHPVAPRLARPNSIKEAHDQDGEFLRPRVGQGGEFVDEFGCRITPAKLSRGTIHAVVRLLQRRMILAAIDL